MMWISLLIIVALCSFAEGRNRRVFCPSKCHCKENKIDCSGQNFTAVLHDISNYNSTIRVTRLYLDNCKIKTEISKNFFKKFPYIRQLHLSYNHLTRLPNIQNLRKLDTLVLSGNNIKYLKSKAFIGNARLQTLLLDHNRIESIPTSSLHRLRRLQRLSLESNRIRKITRAAFYGLSSCSVLSLDSNQIKRIKRGAFLGLSSLVILKLSSNKIKTLKPKSLSGLKNLRTLHLKDNYLQDFPVVALEDVKQLSALTLANNKIKKVPPFAYSGFSVLQSIDIFHQNELREVSHTAFRDMPALTKLKIECNDGATKLSQFPDLTGTLKLKELDLTYCHLQEMPKNFCDNRTSLITLNLLRNQLNSLPPLKGCKNLKFLDIERNRIESLDESFEGLQSLLDLDASHNHIGSIGEKAFSELRNLDLLDLSHNWIKSIHDKAFAGFNSIKRMSLEQNQLKSFPTLGLETLTHLKTKGNPDLIDFPTNQFLPSIKNLVLDYPYHCCYYQRKEIAEEDLVVTKALHSWVFNWAWGNETENDTWPTIDPDTDGSGQGEPLLILNHTETGDDLSQSVPHILNPGDEKKTTLLECQPEPNVFYPCENLMNKQWLRICIWLVFLLALIGNSIVLFIIFANCSKLDVQRFLTLNLALADLMLGIYLGFLAVVDIVTYGNFRAKALHWQYSSSCQTAGFIAVLASELSVYTLTVITVERYITIKYSLYINKQMSVSKAVVIMIFGWIFCAVLASLPIIRINTSKGVLHFSDYRKYSICLPFDIPDEQSIAHTPSIVYLSFVLIFNILAFTVIVYCYIRIFVSIRGSGAFNSGDSRVAKRVALLVFTDFACWFPICILALTAVYGSPFIKDLWLTKVITIFILPLNACANPFLYAIFTKQFHNDCLAMCRRMKISEAGLGKGVCKRFGSGSSKRKIGYRAFRRGSSCSFHIGRRSSTRGEELRMISRSTYRTPVNTDDGRERDRDERDDKRAEFHERETCL